MTLENFVAEVLDADARCRQHVEDQQLSAARLIPPNSCIVAHAEIPGTVNRPIEIRLDVKNAALVADFSHLQTRNTPPKYWRVKLHMYLLLICRPARIGTVDRDILCKAVVELLTRQGPVSTAVSTSVNHPSAVARGSACRRRGCGLVAW